MTNDDDKLSRQAARLNKDIAPERDLWPAIATAIESPSKGGGFHRYFAQAAMVVTAATASAVMTYFVMSDDGSGQVSPIIDVQRTPQQVAYSDNRSSFGPSMTGSYVLGPGFNEARASVKSRLDTELERMSPEARQDVENNLVVIRTAIEEISAALEEHPDSEYLQELLLKTYREELEVMRNVGGLTNNVMSRNDI